MAFSLLVGVLTFVVSFSELVVGDPTSVVTLTSAKVSQNDCGYFGTFVVDIIKTKKSSQLNIKMPVTKDLPPTMMICFIIYLNGPSSEPLEYNMTVCDALSDQMIGQSFVQSGTPKGTFPKVCPLVAGPWVVSKWDPPVNLIPPGLPDGPVTGSVIFGNDDGKSCITIDFVADMKHAIPGLGR